MFLPRATLSLRLHGLRSLGLLRVALPHTVLSVAVDRQKQETLFEDGSKVKHFAVVTNIGEWKAGRH